MAASRFTWPPRDRFSTKVKVTEAALACGPHLPLHEKTATAMLRAGEAARAHPQQLFGQACRDARALRPAAMGDQRLSPRVASDAAARPDDADAVDAHQREDVAIAVDGCGLPTFAIALDAVAEGCARFSAAVAAGEPAPATIFDAIVAHPEYVAGTDRLDTDLMRVAGTRLFAKVGAEGFYCAGIPSMKLGVALKVEDGTSAPPSRRSSPCCRQSTRSAPPSSNSCKFAQPELLNTRREVVGHVRTSLQF